MLVEARSVHASDEIIRNSILQAGFGLRYIAEADEVGHRGIQLFVVIVLAGRGAQTE
jgi:hypothetical protein